VKEGGCEKGQTTVSPAAYTACERSANCSPTPDSRVGFRRQFQEYQTDPQNPRTGVTYQDMLDYTAWLNSKVGVGLYRLPTEAEWERAAKGPQGDNHYPWGHTLDQKKANYGQNVGRTTPVDSYPEGVSGYGLYNMAGNVFEWVEDWYDLKYYKESPALNPRGAEKGYNFANQGPVRVLRGGSWLSSDRFARCAFRSYGSPDLRINYIGFRVVVSRAFR